MKNALYDRALSVLRTEGYRLRVYHTPLYEFPSQRLTEVLIQKDDITEAEGVAYTHPNDQFIRRRGLTIALGRALSQFNLIRPDLVRLISGKDTKKGATP